LPARARSLIAHCRAGFEPETAADLSRLAAELREEIVLDAPAGRGFVVGSLDRPDLRSLARAFTGSPPIFARTLFVGTGPHALFDPGAASGRPDRIGPLVALIEQQAAEVDEDDLAHSADASSGYDDLRLETADTNEGKALSGLTRSLEARLAGELSARGLLRQKRDDEPTSRPTRHLHVHFADGAHAYIGTSASPWASRWAMGIPRLRMPGGAPSRSTLKLAEAFIAFLGGHELESLRAGMRAVDLGAAPGGWSWQLARRGVRVTAVDNGPLKGDVRDDALVTHVRADGLKFLPKRPVDWMVCDIVEQPSRIAALVARWIGEGHARHAIFNLKLPMKRRYDEVRRCEAIIVDALAKAGVQHTLALRQLYHDREEVTGYAARSTDPSRAKSASAANRRRQGRGSRAQESVGMIPRRR
jgi:23S rRNA (cytidine2498-2'-O)-methyltransferase